MKETNKKYKGDIYNGFLPKEKKPKEYEPEVIVERVFNDKTETYEYVERIINHKLDWENTIEGLAAQELFEINEKEVNE